jgi:hypothetical protein
VVVVVLVREQQDGPTGPTTNHDDGKGIFGSFEDEP